MYFLEIHGTDVFDRIQKIFLKTVKGKYTSISRICFFLAHSLHELFSKGKQKLSFNQTQTNTELLVETMLGLNDFLWFPSKTKLNVDFWVEFHFEFLVLFSYEELSETWEVQTIIECSWKMICKTPCYGVLFHTFDLCGCWEQYLCLFQPIKNRPVKALWSHIFLCKDFDIQETTSNPSHRPGASWKVGKPRACPSARKGPSKPAGTTLSTKWSLTGNEARDTQPGILLTSSRKSKIFAFLSWNQRQCSLGLPLWSVWSTSPRLWDVAVTEQPVPDDRSNGVIMEPPGHPTARHFDVAYLPIYKCVL